MTTPALPQPKVFVSYSWTTQAHEERILEWCGRLVADGVDVVVDKWSLSEGHDKFAFMEKMVTDPSITHVLVVTDAAYAAKADSRSRGVGTESQIISAEIYGKTSQDKFLPLVCEFVDGVECVPVFLKGRLYFDFSTPEKVNESWEKLLRRLFNRPLYVKPQLGKVPAYITAPSAPPSLTTAKFQTAKEAVAKGRPAAGLLLVDYLDALPLQLEQHRLPIPEESPENFGEKIEASLEGLIPLRNEIIDLLSVVFTTKAESDAVEYCGDLLEKILPFKYRPEQITSFKRYYWDNYGYFCYETFLYIVALLIRQRRFTALAALFDRRFILPPWESRADRAVDFTEFAFHSELWGYFNERSNPRRLSVEADHVKTRATLPAFPLPALIEADLVAFVRSAKQSMHGWVPWTMVYGGYSRPLEIFVRAQEKKWFARLAPAMAVKDKAELMERLKPYLATGGSSPLGWLTFHARSSFEGMMGLKQLDSL